MALGLHWCWHADERRERKGNLKKGRGDYSVAIVILVISKYGDFFTISFLGRLLLSCGFHFIFIVVFLPLAALVVFAYAIVSVVCSHCLEVESGNSNERQNKMSDEIGGVGFVELGRESWVWGFDGGERGGEASAYFLVFLLYLGIRIPRFGGPNRHLSYLI